MEDHELREVLFRQEALEVFVRTLVIYLRGTEHLSDDLMEKILGGFEESSTSLECSKFQTDEIRGWFESTGGSPGEIAAGLIERTRLKRILFGPRS